MAAGAADSKISNRPVTFESNRNRPNLEYSQVPIFILQQCVTRHCINLYDVFSLCGMLTAGRRNRMNSSLEMRAFLKLNANVL